MAGRGSGDGGGGIRWLVREYGWIHTGIGIFGNFAFLVGSVLFFWESTKTAGIWLFVVGAAGMLIGSIGDAILKAEED